MRKWLSHSSELERRDVPSVVAARWVDQEIPSGIFASAFTAEGRIGNTIAGGGTFELDVSKSTAGPFKAGETADFKWAKNTPTPFRVEYDAGAGLVTFTSGGITVTTRQSFGNLVGEDTLMLRTRAVQAGSSVELTDLNLTFGGVSVAIPDPDGGSEPAATGSVGVNDRDVLQVVGVNLRDGFVLTGNSVWDWAATAKADRLWQSQLAFQLSAGTLTKSVVSVARAADAVENGAAGRFVFTRTGDVSQPLMVNILVSGSATSGDDYVALPATVTFAANSATATLTVTPKSDNEFEDANDDQDGVDPETVVVTVTSGVGYVPNRSAAVVSVTDDPPRVTASVAWSLRTDSNVLGQVTLTRTGGNIAEPLKVWFEPEAYLEIDGQQVLTSLAAVGLFPRAKAPSPSRWSATTLRRMVC